MRKKRRLGHAGNGCARRRAAKINEVWSYDFLFDQTADGRPLKILPIVDEFTRECLVMLVGRSLAAQEVLGALAKAARQRGMPEHLRSDNGPEFIADAVKQWLKEGGPDAVHRAGQPLGERLQRVVQQQAAGRVVNGELFSSEKEAVVLLEHIDGLTTMSGHTARWGTSPRLCSLGSAWLTRPEPRPTEQSVQPKLSRYLDQKTGPSQSGRFPTGNTSPLSQTESLNKMLF